MLTHPQHFGITVADGKKSVEFYTRVLRLPFIATTEHSGSRFDEMYRLKGAVNRVSWFQIGDSGTELFHLPSHPPAGAPCSPLAAAGYRYIAYSVRGFTGYISRIKDKGAAVITAGSAHGRCAKVSGPDGENILLFDSGESSRIGSVASIKEAGIVITGPLETYREFFAAVGLEVNAAPPEDFISPLFGYEGEVRSELYGRIRIISLPAEALPPRPRMFPFEKEERIDNYSDAGIKHIAYYVDDIKQFYIRAASRGVYFLFPPVRIPGGSRMAYFSDPEGHVIEVMQISRPMRLAARAAGRLAGFLERGDLSPRLLS